LRVFTQATLGKSWRTQHDVVCERPVSQRECHQNGDF